MVVPFHFSNSLANLLIMCSKSFFTFLSMIILLIILGKVLCVNPKIDIMVRSFEREAPLLLMFLRSFEIFFPMEHLGELFIILDETKRDYALGSLLPAFVHVVYEDPVGVQTTHINPHENRNDGGRTASQISNFFSDKYGNADIIGIVDSDVVFRSPAMYDMLVSNGKPRLFCSHHRGAHRLGADAAKKIDSSFQNMPFDFDCMENFPFLMWRSSFVRMQKWLGKQMKTSNVKKSLVDLVNAHSYYNFFGNFELMGYYLFTYEKDKYSVVVGGNGLYSTCPEFRPSLHVHYSLPNWRDFPDKLSWDYFRAANRAIHNGILLCSNTTTQKRKLKIIYTFLSLEGKNEYMFGVPGNLAKAGCDQHLETIVAAYMKALQEWCKNF